MTNKLIDSYQEIIVKIVVASLRSFGRPVGREIFISMLKRNVKDKVLCSVSRRFFAMARVKRIFEILLRENT